MNEQKALGHKFARRAFREVLLTEDLFSFWRRSPHDQLLSVKEVRPLCEASQYP